jgi:hypothetical protein
MGMFSDRYKDAQKSARGYLRFDGQVEFYKPPKKGGGAIDFIPYVIKTDNHPAIVSGNSKVKKGSYDWNLDVWIHRSVGPGSVDVICPKETYRGSNKGCPICEYVEELKTRNGKDDETFKALRAKRRGIYNVIDLTEEDDTIKIFEVANFLFEKELLDKAAFEGKKIGQEYIDFADPVEGFSVEFRGDKINYKDFTFVKRDYAISEKLMKKATSLDELLVVYSYKELKDILYGVGEDDEDEKPVRRSRSHKEVEDEEEDRPVRRRVLREEPDDEEEKEKPVRRLNQKPDDEEDEKPVRRRKVYKDDDEEDSPPEEDEKPKVSKRSVRNDDDEEDSPVYRQEGCPFDHTFGKDNDMFPECDECDVWEKCRAASKKK